MRSVLIDPGSPGCENLGDVAMLQAAIAHMRARWPDARVAVLTADPDALRRHCPGAEPVPEAGREAAVTALMPWRLSHALPLPARLVLEDAEREARARWTTPYLATIHRRAARRGHDAAGMDAYLGALHGADLVLAAGQACLVDAGGEQARRLLDGLDLALAAGGRVAAMGQALGPLTNPRLLALARRVLPRALMVGLREPTLAPRLAAELGIPAERAAVTGDDAVGLARRAAPGSPGAALGIHVRRAPRAFESDADLVPVRQALAAFLAGHPAPLVPLPISSHRVGSHDPRAIAALLAPLEGAVLDETGDCATVTGLIARVGRCRMVVSGAYHAAVFALSQGVPVVALGASELYRVKFDGLAALFPGGVTVVDPTAPGGSGALVAAMRQAWDRAPVVRAGLLSAADRQSADAARAWGHLFDRVPAPAMGGAV